MKRYSKGLALILISTIGFSSNGYSQPTYKIETTKDVDMKLLGTSTLHKWEMETTSMSGEVQFVFKSGSESDFASLKSLSFGLEVKDLKSDSKGLDKNAYKALKSDEFKDIHYKPISAMATPAKKNEYLLKTSATLTVAGVTKQIDMDVNCLINANGSITFTGTDKLNITDYNVEPPSFMLGAMKTGDAIALQFNVVYKI